MTRNTKKKQLRRRSIHRKNTPRPHISTNIVVVGKIYANWCGHCTALLPEWEKMTDFIDTKLSASKKSNTKYVFSEIEQSEQDAKIRDINNSYLQNSAEKLALQDGFPTLFKIYNGKLEYYNGDRRYLDMLHWYTSAKTRNISTQSGAIIDTTIPILSKYEGGKSRNNRRSSIYSRKPRSIKKGVFSFVFS
jgi:thiol-disulfide isomerase/thioredoxin